LNVIVLAAEFYAGNIFETCDTPPFGCFYDNLLELFDVAQASENIDGILKTLPFRCGRLSDLTGSNLYILLPDSIKSD
jgi:hypothetical protein